MIYGLMDYRKMDKFQSWNRFDTYILHVYFGN